MATYTANYNLEKPDQSEYYDVDVFNGNADVIDSALKGLREDVDAAVPKDSIYVIYTTTGTATAFAVAGITVQSGGIICLKLHVDTGANPTLSLSGGAAVPLLQEPGKAFKGKSGGVYTFRCDGGNFLLQGGGWGAVPFIASATLTAAGWVNGVQSVPVTGVMAASCGDLYSAPAATAEQDKAFNSAQLKVTAQDAGSLTVTCRGAVPTIDLPIEVEVRN